MRLSLIANPVASRASRRRVEVVRASLCREHKVDVEVTRHRGDATVLAREAVLDGAEAVVVVGGDGTVAEACAALVGTDIALGAIPAGGTNVLARTLGVPEKTPAALAHLRRALFLGPRPIGLGRAVTRPGEEARVFAFVAGFGFDAATVHRVEGRRRLKRVLGDALYTASAVQAFTSYDRQRPALALHLPDGTVVDGIFHLMVANSSPYSYLGSLPILVTPGAHVNRPLAVAAFRRMSLGFTLRMFGSAIAGGRALARSPHVTQLFDLPRLEVRADPPVELQLDGDLVGPVSRVELSWQPAAVRFLA